MRIFKVGGCIRDKLLGLPVNDTDYVVVDSSPLEMESLGYQRVGKDFPVYLHPESGDEYALARTERSTGASYSEFTFNTANVTLGDDLARRDLTMNAIAEDSLGLLLDPHNGIKDIQNKILRHTSKAFVEDPVRVLRIARFMTRLGTKWRIAPETKVLIYSMGESLMSLQPDRVWKEVEKVLNLPNSHIFFETLFELGVLGRIFPHIYELTRLKEGSIYHRESSVFEHTMQMLKIASNDPIEIKLAILYHDIAKPHTYRTYGNGSGHDNVDLIEERIDITKLPSTLRKDMLFLAKQHIKVYTTDVMKSTKLASFLEEFSSMEQLHHLLLLANADDVGRINEGKQKAIESELLILALTRILSYSPKDWLASQPTRPSGEVIKQHVHKYNISVIDSLRGN